MDRRRLRPALVLCAWTFFVWTTRIRNIWTDDSLTTGGQAWRTALSLSFTAFAAAVVVLWVRARQDRHAVPSSAAVLVRAFAVWTTGVWVLRGVQIGAADHEVAFKAVHTVLAVVSIALAWWADRAVHASPATPTPSRLDVGSDQVATNVTSRTEMSG